ncbi:MAG: hypothetical protein J5J00_15080 [Deltaproteobacteria bacterium]|nr:hypothetical protein [Deltaproteobacteria bacterium]
MMRLLLIAIFVIGLACSPVDAEIYNCEGKWTNKPCSGAIEESIAEVTRPESQVELPPSDQPIIIDATKPKPTEPPTLDLTQRLELERRIKKSNDKAKQEGKKHLSRDEIEKITRICRDTSKPLKECQSVVNKSEKRLEGAKSSVDEQLLGEIE